MIPERGPLHALVKLIVCKKNIHLLERVAEIRCDDCGKAVLNPRREFYVFYFNTGLRGDIAFK